MAGALVPLRLYFWLLFFGRFLRVIAHFHEIISFVSSL